MDPRIAAVIARMEQTLEERTSLAGLAAAVNLSVSRLSHLFRAQVGVPPGRYLQTIRMQRSRILLERTSLAVKDVMARVGVADPSHFARDFRKYHGIAPSQVRRASDGSGDLPPLLLAHLNRASAAAPGAARLQSSGADPQSTADDIRDHPERQPDGVRGSAESDGS